MTNPSGRPPRDRTGETYNNLTVISSAPCEQGEGRWLCRCSCGNEQEFTTKQLVRAKFCDACRPSRIRDLAGQTFGLLTVVCLDPDTKPVRWICKCACGAQKSIVGTALTTGNTQSCGCLQRTLERKQKDGYLQKRHDVLIRSKIASYKANARNRGFEWNLTDDQVKLLFGSNCHYCKAPPSNIVSHEKLNQFVFYSGIDRVDNDGGYTPTNVVPCCRDCNLAKRDRDLRSFLVWIHQVAKHTPEPEFDLALDVSDYDATRHPVLLEVLSLFDDERGDLPLNLANVLNGSSEG